MTRGGAIDFIPDERSLTDELRGYVRMMAIAVQRQHEDGENEYQINLNETDLAILNALEDNRARSGRELAGQTVTTPETVARRLPRLRLLGYVDSYRQGRSTMNAITATGRTALTKPRWAVGRFAPRQITGSHES
ncbi:MAG: AsnC family transcriptional regulator [Sphingomonas sp.]